MSIIWGCRWRLMDLDANKSFLFLLLWLRFLFSPTLETGKFITVLCKSNTSSTIYFPEKSTLSSKWASLGARQWRLRHSAGDPGWIPGAEKIPRGERWQPTPVFVPGEPHGSLAGYTAHGLGRRVRHCLVTKQQQKHPPNTAFPTRYRVGSRCRWAE